MVKGNPSSVQVMIIGSGMITNDTILPSIYHLQREGIVSDVTICATSSKNLRALAANEEIREAFPGHSFEAHPSLTEDPSRRFPQLYREMLAKMPPRQFVIVAIPDDLHFEVVMEALRNDQHVLCVKPLVLEHAQAEAIRREAWDRGLFVGIEYHKRFDRRSLLARRHYRAGNLGEFVIGEAKMIEPYFYRNSNFQSWFTVERTDPFVYVGCHYVDLVEYITGLRPVEVSVAGIKGRFPNGVEAYMWANGRVRYENGAILSVISGLGYPDTAAGSNDQCLSMFFEGGENGGSALLKHDDQFRGLTANYVRGIGPAGQRFNFVNPDFFRLVPWEGDGLRPIGYGYDSIAHNLQASLRVEAATDGEAAAAVKLRQAVIREIDEKGIIATPANSATNELVIEAARKSIAKDGAPEKIALR